MIEIIVKASDSRQRSDKFIMKLLPSAPKSLIYKQMRKKNITLNNLKMTGSEILSDKDTIQFFFSEETFCKFSQIIDDSYIKALINDAKRAYDTFSNIDIVYEDDNIICVNKTDNLLSQKADNDELSLNEWLIGYLLNKGVVSEESLNHFKPSVLNRLDKNTTGLVLCSKTLVGANTISELLRNRTIDKFYLTVVTGVIENDGIYKAYHTKDVNNNIVSIADDISNPEISIKYSEIYTGIKTLNVAESDLIGKLSLLEIDLITGKSHQIRAHLAHLGHPVFGDYKYGNKNVNEKLKSIGINHQMLHSYKMIMPDNLPEPLNNLNNKVIICEPPNAWRKLNVDLEIKRS